MNLTAHLAEQAEVQPEAPALIDGDGRACSFAELEARSARAAAQFQSTGGLTRGDTVLVAQPFSARLYVVLGGVLRAGLTAMLPDPSADRERLAECCRQCPPDAFVGPPKAHLLRLLVPAVRRIPRAFVTGRWPVPGATRLRTDRGEAAPVTDCDADTPALLTFTSGSTGAPKAVARTHGLLNHQYRALRNALDLRAGQTDLVTLPVFALANLAAGVTSVLPDADLRSGLDGFDAAPVLAQLRRERPDRLAASPAFAERLLAAPGGTETLASVERIALGGAPVPPAFLQRLRDDALAGAERTAVYGSTEAEPISHVAAGCVSDADRATTRAGGGLLVGTPVEEVAVRIRPDRWGTPIGPFSEEGFEEETLPPGEAGEIVVRGAHVVPSYRDGRGDAEAKFDVDGARWHRTGDAGRFDENGRLWLLGRCGAKVEDERGRCYPLSVTAAARTVDGVRQAAFTAHRGRRVLVVETNGPTGALSTALRALLRERLSWVHLDAVRFTDALPTDRRHDAKVDYPALRRLLAETFDEQPISA
jgi:acyl-CoA synthetase (AMP-forming)/AMP-acid ligase II